MIGLLFHRPRLVVAITGAKGSGKTTLAEDLVARLRGEEECVPVLHAGIGQKAAALGVSLGASADLSTIITFAKLHMQRERAIRRGLHVLDRSLVDLLAYARLNCQRDSALVELITEIAAASVARIDLVVYVPLIVELSESRSVDESTEYRSRLDATITQVLADLDVPCLRTSGSRHERVEQVRQHLLSLRPHAEME